jgi:hypothetical protein
MTGSWNFQLEDGQHSIKADVNPWIIRLRVYFDNNLINTSFVLMVGDIYKFERNGHRFIISVKGLGYLGQLALSIDGTEVNQGGMLAPPPPPPQQQVVPSPAQFIQEVNVTETSEVYRTEEYPFDNSFGNREISTERQFSEESTNEFTLGVTNQVSGKVGLEAFSILKAEVAAEVSKQVGHKIGEKVTESQTLSFSVGAKSAVVYRIIWKRNIRAGEYLYLINGNTVSIPYRMKYGLSVEVQTREHSRRG